MPEAAVGAVRDTLREHGEPVSAGGMTFMQARTANEVLKAQERRLRLQQMKGELVDRAKAVAQVFRLAREERDAWVNWPARVAAMMAAELSASGSEGGRCSSRRSTSTACTRCWSAMCASISPSWPRSGRACADRHQEIGLMLRTLRQHPLLVGMAEVLADAVRYVAIVLVVLVVLGQVVAALGS